MKHPQFLFACCSFSIFAAASSSKDEGLSCVTDYWYTVSCVLNITGDSSNTTYSLEFRSLADQKPETYLCPLVRMNTTTYHTACKLRDGQIFSSASNYSIQLCTAFNNCQSLRKSFEPTSHIQLTAPLDVKVQQTPSHFHITWKSGYETHLLLSKALQYQLLLEASKGNKPFNQILHSRNQGFESVPRAELKSYDTYCIKVKSFSEPHETQSEWSNRTCWRGDGEQAFSENSSGQENAKTPVIVTKVLAPVCVVLAVLLFLFYSPAARMKIKTLSNTPSPAPFFQPLFEQYDGNLQDWLSHNKCTIMSKTEEMLTTSAVTFEPVPLKKNLEENLDFLDPLLMLPATQSQTSYVGLPRTHQASSPVTVVCPGDTSYTQLPCSMWGVNLGGIQVEPSPPKDSLEISCFDSGCSFDSLTESPDCSLPSSPAVDTSPPFHCSSYCILNRTTEGVVPVLVTTGSSPRDTDPPRDADGS